MRGYDYGFVSGLACAGLSDLLVHGTGNGHLAAALILVPILILWKKVVQ